MNTYMFSIPRVKNLSFISDMILQMENNSDKVHGNDAEIPGKEDRTATDSGGIYDTETQTNTTNGLGFGNYIHKFQITGSDQ